MAKKKKKHKKSKPSPKPTQVKDLGAQEIIRIENKLYRLPDYKELKMGLKHIYGVFNSNLQKYYAKNLLCPQDHKINTLRFLAGEKLEALAVYSSKQKSITFNWDKLDNIVPRVKYFFYYFFHVSFISNYSMKIAMFRQQS